MRTVVLILTSALLSPLYAADVCTLFPRLRDFDGKIVVVTGEILIAPDVLAIAGLCTPEYFSPGRGPAALQLDLSFDLEETAKRQVADARQAAGEAIAQGTFIRATAEIEGLVELGQQIGTGFGPDGKFPGRILVMRIRNLEWQVQPRARSLPVISVCDLFRDLPSYRGKRIAVRGELAVTGEGSGLGAGANCPYRFETGSFVWPQGLTLDGWPNVYASTFRRTTAPFSFPLTKRPLGPMGLTRPTTVVTLVGILNVREHYTVRCQSFKLSAFGLGNDGEAPAALAVEDIFDVAIEEREPVHSTFPRDCDTTPEIPQK